MQRMALLLGALIFASPLFALEPSESEVNTEYDKYLMAVCSPNCPPGVSDVQARIRILQAYCNQNGTGPTCSKVAAWEPVPALIYDHASGLWRAEPALERRTELDVNGTPTTDLARGDSLVVVIENTNPLLYKATAGKIELKAIEQLSDLQTLAGLLGGNASALSQAAAADRKLGPEIVGTAGSEVEAVANALQKAASPFLSAQRLADCITLRAQAATAFIQAVESGRDFTYPPHLPQCDGLDASAETVRGQTVALAATRGLVGELVARRCLELPKAVEDLLALNAPSVESVRMGINAYDSAARSLSCAAWDEPLDGTMGTTETAEAEIERLIVKRLRDEVAKPNPDLPKLYADLKKNQQVRVQRLVLATREAKAVEDPLLELIGTLPTLGKVADNLDLFRERVIENVVGNVVGCGQATPAPCVPSSSVATFLVVPGKPSRVTRWESIHSRTVKVAVDSPFAGDVVARRSCSVESGYSVRSPLASIFDIGLGITDTDIQSPTFGAVREDPEVFGSESKLVVGVVNEESQAGKVALLLNVVPFRLWDVPKLVKPLGIQVGAGADSCKPALFWGISYGLGKYVRIGWGKTAQRVTALRDETPLGSRVASKDEIRMRQKYEQDDYWSLMISIRTLRLFTK